MRMGTHGHPHGCPLATLLFQESCASRTNFLGFELSKKF